MHNVASPCAGQVRLRKTFAGRPSIRHTSAGHAAWQTGHRLVVRLSSCSVATIGRSADFMGSPTVLMPYVGTLNLELVRRRHQGAAGILPAVLCSDFSAG